MQGRMRGAILEVRGKQRERHVQPLAVAGEPGATARDDGAVAAPGGAVAGAEHDVVPSYDCAVVWFVGGFDRLCMVVDRHDA